MIVYRAFYAPDVTTYAEGGAYPERACVGCSMVADQVAHPAHLNARDTTLAFVSRAPQAEIQGLKERMGWELIPWYTLTDGFDADFGVDERHGTNAFIREGYRIFRTYFVYSRGDEAMGSTWSYLDITALGRQEEWEGLARGVSADAALPVVELPRRVRRGRVSAHQPHAVQRPLPAHGVGRASASQGRSEPPKRSGHDQEALRRTPGAYPHARRIDRIVERPARSRVGRTTSSGEDVDRARARAAMVLTRRAATDQDSSDATEGG